MFEFGPEAGHSGGRDHLPSCQGGVMGDLRARPSGLLTQANGIALEGL